ncbi:MAG: glycosyl transferase, group 2 family protein [uncultured bacterium]|nr:MAG: glycosyl transferase, group 2 family protein [uncultured bacterium]
MEKDLVSIAMATYNGESYLREQLDSIFNQTYKNIEVVVTDDCSTDNTIAILDEYSQKYNLKYYINERNLGFIKNFERVLPLCNGNYIALSDQDDIWLPEKLEILMSQIRDYTLVCSDATLINTKGSIINESFRDYSNLNTNTAKPFRTLVFSNYVTGCTCLFKKELLNNAIPVPDDVLFHDWWFGVVASTINGIKYIDKPLILYRQHSKNFIGANRYKKNSFFKRLALSIISLSYKKRKVHKKSYLQIKKNLKIILNSGLYLDKDNKDFIEKTLKYYDSMLNSNIDIESIKFAFNNRDLFFKEDDAFLFFILLRYLPFMRFRKN